MDFPHCFQWLVVTNMLVLPLLNVQNYGVLYVNKDYRLKSCYLFAVNNSHDVRLSFKKIAGTACPNVNKEEQVLKFL